MNPCPFCGATDGGCQIILCQGGCGTQLGCLRPMIGDIWQAADWTIKLAGHFCVPCYQAVSQQ